jgi:hypothetical protein
MHKVILKDVLHLFILKSLYSQKIYDTNSVERLAQMHKYCISVYSSFISFVVSFQNTKSLKYKKVILNDIPCSFLL